MSSSLVVELPECMAIPWSFAGHATTSPFGEINGMVSSTILGTTLLIPLFFESSVVHQGIDSVLLIQVISTIFGYQPLLVQFCEIPELTLRVFPELDITLILADAVTATYWCGFLVASLCLPTLPTDHGEDRSGTGVHWLF